MNYLVTRDLKKTWKFDVSLFLCSSVCPLLVMQKKFFIIFCLFFSFGATAQGISNELLRDLLRNKQSPRNSYMINPNRVDFNELDSLMGSPSSVLQIGKKENNIRLRVLPLYIQQQYNSALPYGWNIAPMLPAKGYQTVISTGLQLRAGKHWVMQVAPEFVYADNKPFEGFSQQLSTASWTAYYRFLNTTDIPTRFGDDTYRKILPGQSSLKYQFKSFAVGVSTEQMWWGPGSRNALIMSTNAPGFLHAGIQTIRPVKTSIGGFEGQLIGGRLSESNILPPRIFSVDTNGQFLYQPKTQQWRYMTGMVLSWRPKWVPSLYVGFAKASYLYNTDISSPLDILPLQGFFGGAVTGSEKAGKKASLGSFFARYVMPEEHAELYIEYGRKDVSLMPWNVIRTDAYRRAYVAGFRKLFIRKRGGAIQLHAELTQMQAPTAELIRDPDSWYTHRYVRQGYTNMGRSLGAGIGPGSNSQSLEISWVKGPKKLGILFERLRHNSDFYYYAFEGLKDFRRHWVDLSTTFIAAWNYKKWYANAQLAIIRSFNYQWLIIDSDPTNYFVPGNEYLNVSGRMGIGWRF